MASATHPVLDEMFEKIERIAQDKATIMLWLNRSELGAAGNSCLNYGYTTKVHAGKSPETVVFVMTKEF